MSQMLGSGAGEGRIVGITTTRPNTRDQHSTGQDMFSIIESKTRRGDNNKNKQPCMYELYCNKQMWHKIITKIFKV
jgi:hypothetical protein